ncbi:MAG: winged helix-turn-helix transcriptional regulator, partial [Promethearchaeota archaeon]
MAFNYSSKVKRTSFSLGLFLMIFIVPFIGLQQTAKAWTVYNHELSANVQEDFKLPNNISIHILANTTGYVSIFIDNSIHDKDLFVNATSKSSINIVLDIKREFPDKHLRMGKEVEVQGSHQTGRYKYVFEFSMRLELNDSNAIVFLNTTMSSTSTNKEKLNWIGKSLNAPGDSPWELINTTISDSYISTTTPINSGYFTVVEEFVPFNWMPVIGFVAILVIIGLSILIMSRSEYLRIVSLRSRGKNIPVHRMSLDKVINNKTRRKILDIVLSSPGIHFNELLRRLDIESGALNWHLGVLEDYNVIKREKIDQYISFFPKIPLKNDYPLLIEAVKLMKNKKLVEILMLLEEGGRMYQSELSNALNLDKRMIRYYGNKLEQQGFITFITEDGKKYHEITAKGAAVL